jgi:matrixin
MTSRRFAYALSLAILLALPASAQAGGHVASATGVKQVKGKTLYVDVVVAVPAGQTARHATDRALSEQGASRAKPPWAGGPGGGSGGGGGGGGGEQYFFNGLKWSPPTVTQNYNGANAPIAAQTALVNTYSDWSNVTGSTYRISSGGTTTRCPSLVKECPGAQVNDARNDVGWAGLGGTTLGVTWFTPSSPEADMALNTHFTWKNTCGTSGGSAYDVETVFLHENGHVAGLDHANRTDSVMYPSYQAPRCTLFDYDRRSIANLY